MITIREFRRDHCAVFLIDSLDPNTDPMVATICYWPPDRYPHRIMVGVHDCRGIY